MEQVDQYKNIMTELIKKQMVILGPGVAIGTARKVAGLQIQEDGSVSQIDINPQEAMSSLARAYMDLSGEVARNTLDSILVKYKDIKLT